MRWGAALTLSLITHPLIMILLLQTNVFGVEAVAHVLSPIPPDFPEVLRVCADPVLEGDVAWAAGEWNRALASYGLRLRLEPVGEDCAVYVQSSDVPLGGLGENRLAGGMIDIKPKNWTLGTVVSPEEIRFSMLDIRLTVWGTENVALRRGIILHELGHALLLSHLVDFRGTGPRPVMLEDIHLANPPESVTELDAYLAWLTHSYCRDKACPLMHVRVQNAPASAVVATAVSAGVALTLMVADFGRVRRKA